MRLLKARRLIGSGLIAGAVMLSLGMAGRPRGLTMMVVPARYSVLQVAFDMERRYPVILVSYQGDASSGTPLIHAWDGREWVYVSLEDYAQAAFLRRRPERIVLVGDEEQLPPVLVDASRWCPLVMSIPSEDTSTIINSMGKVLDFGPADWQWFAARYNLRLYDLNAEERRKSWYDHAPEEVLPWLAPPAAEGDETETKAAVEKAEEYEQFEEQPPESPIIESGESGPQETAAPNNEEMTGEEEAAPVADSLSVESESPSISEEGSSVEPEQSTAPAEENASSPIEEGIK